MRLGGTTVAPHEPTRRVAADILAWHLLGEGPHCATWAGWSIDRWAPVVVKVPLASAEPARALASLQREADHLTRLCHPAFPRLFAAVLDSTTPYLVIELLEGQPLSHVARSPLSVGDTVRLGLQLASAVRYLHGLGIVHLDLKPDNVMMRGGRAIVIDLGAAQALGAAPPNGPRGTPGFMSPEQAEAREPATFAMDLWSLGAILGHALTGRAAPVPGERLSWRLRRAPRRLRDLVVALVDPDPAHRPRSATEVLHELGQLEGSPKRGWAPAVARGQLPFTTCMERPPDRWAPGLGLPRAFPDRSTS